MGGGESSKLTAVADTYLLSLAISKDILEADSNQKPVHKVKPSDPLRQRGTLRSLTGDSTPPKQIATHLL